MTDKLVESFLEILSCGFFQGQAKILAALKAE